MRSATLVISVRKVKPRAILARRDLIGKRVAEFQQDKCDGAQERDPQDDSGERAPGRFAPAPWIFFVGHAVGVSRCAMLV
jgi:hypothetical protein